MSKPHLLSAVAAFALAATASAQATERTALSFPAPQGDIKTPAPAPAISALPEAPRPSPAPDVAPPKRAGDPQDEHAGNSLPLGIDFSVVRYQDGPDGALWARGASYKMRFDAQAATLIPFFSSQAPRNFDVAFELESVRLGGDPLALADSASVRRDADAITLDHGDVDEVYELGLKQLEQKFVFESLPLGGELVLQLGVKTELAGSSDADGFTFANDWGSVHYGRATAIDANGRSLALEASLVDGEIRIVVPAAFVAQAALPLTIDPVLSIFGVDATASTSFSPDSAYDTSGGGVLHVYNVVYSANDYDVGGFATDRWGNVWQGSFFWNDFTAAHWVRPRIAHNRQTDRFLVAATVGQPGSRAIWGQVRSVWSNSLGNPAVISGPEIGEKLNVDVGGDPWPGAPSYFLIAYERNSGATDHDIHARLIDINGVSLSSPGTLFLDNTIGTLDALPSISKSNDSQIWNIAWQRDVPGYQRQIMGARVTWNGAVSTPSFLMLNDLRPNSRPSVSSSIGGTNRYLVACERDYGSDNDIYVLAVNGSLVETALNVSVLDNATMLRDQREPAVDCDGGHFMVAFTDLFPPTVNDYDVYATELQWSAAGLSARENRIVLAYTGAREGDPQIAAAESSNPVQNAADYTVIFNRGIEPVSAGPTDDIIAALVVGSYGGQVATFCTKTDVACPCGIGFGPGACPNSVYTSGAHMASTGQAKTSADTLAFQITAMRPNAVYLVFQGTSLINGGAGNVLGDGVRCAGGFTTRFAAHVSDSSGNGSYPSSGDPSITFAGQVPAFGGVFYYQTWYRDPASFCTAGTTNLSDGVKVEWTP